MRKALFSLCFFLTPFVPAFFYARSAGTGFETYTASIVLGVYAFVLVCDQFILASRPGFAVKVFGTKGLLSVHMIVPVLILALAGIHKLLKAANGFPDDSPQATLGAAAWWTFAVAVAAAVLFMANTFWLRLGIVKRLRSWVYATARLDYKKSRVLHNVTVLAALTILIHVSLASSSYFPANPVGIGLLAVWMVFSLGLYLTYRLRGRSMKGNAHE